MRTSTEPGSRPHIVMTMFGRCGSVFTHSLFDGHPQLASIPGIAAFPVMAEAAKVPTLHLATTKELAYFAAKRFAFFFTDDTFRRPSGLDRLGDNADESIPFDITEFHRQVLAALTVRSSQPPLARLSESLQDAFAACHGLPQKPRVFVHAHTMAHSGVTELVAQVPEHDVLLLVREPVDNIESVFNTVLSEQHLRNNRYAWLHGVISDMMAVQAGEHLHLDRNAVVVRFEDLKKTPRATLEKLCTAIKLPFDETLLQSTFMGKKFNTLPSQRNPDLRGLEAPASNPAGYRLTAHDRAFFATLFRHAGARFGYPEQTGATASDMQRVLDGKLLDIEIELGRDDGLPEADVARHVEVSKFRRFLATRPDILTGPPCPLECRHPGDSHD